jgi:FdhE protein
MRQAPAAPTPADWRPWVALLDAVQRELGARVWHDAASAAPPAASPPLLAGVTFSLDQRSVRRFIGELAHAASGARSSTLTDTVALELLEAAINQSRDGIERAAGALGLDATPVKAWAPLAPVPLLHACRETWTAEGLPPWSEGHCPLCGDWPLLAEARGLERARVLRCGRCGSGWRTNWLQCPFCGNSDHTLLGSLVAEAGGQTRTVDTCQRCLGYVKTLTVLQATPPAELGRRDLETVDLDLAAVQRGYARPSGPACALAARVVARASPGLFARLAGSA